MKTKITIALALIAAFAAVTCARLLAADTANVAKYEYVTIRWGGRDNTQIVRPGGQVEFIGSELKKAPKPKDADDRAFYMNLALNGLSKEGFELVAISSDDMVLRRAR
jgi:hypothetical protein